MGLAGCLSPLYKAAESGNVAEIRKLTAAGANPNEVSFMDTRWTPLMSAVLRDQADSVRALLAVGAEPFMVSRWGPSVSQRGTARQFALSRGNVEIAQILKDAEDRRLARDSAYPPQAASRPSQTPGERAAPHEDDFALVIGIEDYESVAKADYGLRDARAVRKHLEALGWPARNIVSLEGQAATDGKLKSYLREWLPLNVKEDSTLFVYYSGHGAPDPVKGDAYLVPWDGDPSFLKSTAYPLKEFYSDLSKLKAKRVIVALDACFSGAGERSVLAKGARPLVVTLAEDVPATGNLTVFAAAGGDEITGTLDDQGHGTFIYYLLKGLSGAAKDAHGEVTAKGLFDYLKPRVEDEGRRQNRVQIPTFSGSADDAPLATY